MKAISTLTEAKQHVKNAWVAALVIAGITLAFSIAGMSGFESLGFNAWTLTDVALTLGLAYGIFRYNRASAVIMLLYYIISQGLLAVQLQKPPSVLAVLFVYCFFQGIRGTFAYHQLKGQAIDQPIASSGKPIS